MIFKFSQQYTTKLVVADIPEDKRKLAEKIAAEIEREHRMGKYRKGGGEVIASEKGRSLMNCWLCISGTCPERFPAVAARLDTLPSYLDIISLGPKHTI